jgi:flagellar biosynthesis protein FliR
MLAVDISFLTVPGVDDPSIQSKPAATTVIYLSTLCAMGSLVISLVLSGRISDSKWSPTGSAVRQAKFMISMARSVFGIKSLAFMLSLPFALLVWG